MNIKTKTVNLTVISASKGKVLTNGIIYSEVGGDIYVSSNDSIDNYWEITSDEYAKVMQEEADKAKEATKEM